MLAMTSDFHGENRNTGDIRETLEKIARFGFSHVHWCHEWTGEYLYSIYEMLQIREWCDELGLRVKGVHATDGMKRKPFDAADPRDCFEQNTKYYISLNEHNRMAGLELIKNRVDMARILDAEAIVLHFSKPWQVFDADTAYREQFYCQAFKSFDELEPYCRTRHIRVCIENDDAPRSHAVYAFDTLFERYDSGFMGLCFDTGHANISGLENSLEYAERYNDRIFMIHTHDNQGEKDEHILPFEGTFNWEGFAKVLACSPYQFPVLMEPSFRQGGDDGPWLERAFQVGNRLAAMVESARQKP